MRRSEKLKEIYAELRATGIEAPASDLIRIAHIILRAYSGEDEATDEFGRPREGRSLADLPVDKAMEDGGWRVLEHEERRSNNIDDLDPERLESFRHQAKKVTGTQWHHQPPQD
jgi:hypothetical protein